MTTKLNKPVHRLTNELRREAGRVRPIVISIYPGGYIGLRLQGCRGIETIPMQAVYERAVKMRLAKEAADKMAKKAAKAGVSVMVYARRKRGR